MHGFGGAEDTPEPEPMAAGEVRAGEWRGAALSENESFKSLVAERAAAKAGAAAAPVAKSPVLKPRDAATLIIIDSEGSAPKILLGKRRPDLKFMPGKYVFPGGRMDADDKTIAAARELRQGEAAKLLIDMKGRPSAARARGLALTAVRETFEEAGLIIGGAGGCCRTASLRLQPRILLSRRQRPRRGGSFMSTASRRISRR